MGTTSTYGLPFPELGDAPDGPTQLADLAEAVELELERIDGTAADLAERGDSAVTILTTDEDVTATAPAPIGTAGELSLDLDSPGPSAVYMVNADLDLDGGAMTGGGVAVVQLSVDGVADSALIVSNAADRVIQGRRWRVTGLAAGVHTLELEAYRAGGSGYIRIRRNSSTLMVERQA